jgi:transcriptional regulator with XRE-family HTH domain
MGRKPQRRTIVDELRQAIQQSGQSQYALAKSVGVDQSVISRFMAGQRDVTLATAAKLAVSGGQEVGHFGGGGAGNRQGASGGQWRRDEAKELSGE